MLSIVLHEILDENIFTDNRLTKDLFINAICDDKYSLYDYLWVNCHLNNTLVNRIVKKYFPNKKQRDFRRFLLEPFELKYCPTCKNVYSIEFFNKNKARSDGLASQCKSCFSGTYKDWYEKNVQEQIQRVKKRQRNQDRFLSDEEINFIFSRDQNRCQSCGYEDLDHQIDFGLRLSLDHIIPLSKGGPTSIDNIQLLCRSCNSKKSNN